jgi:hypothetical protein
MLLVGSRTPYAGFVSILGSKGRREDRVVQERRGRADVLMNSVMKQPSALLPIGMSLAALALVLAHLAIFGVVREADEGAAAHLWQLLMAGQLPLVLYFAVKWLPHAPVPRSAYRAPGSRDRGGVWPVYLLNL